MAHRDDVGPVPEDNRPGHHPDVEQDQPPAEAFARRLGLVPPADDSSDDGPDEDTAEGGPEVIGLEPDPADTLDEVLATPESELARGDEPAARAPAAEWLAAGPAAPARARALLDAAGPPAGPVTPVEVVAETMELGVRFATAMALLPLRVTTASVRMALRLAGRDR